MEIVDGATKNRVLSKVKKYLNIDHYYDAHELSDNEFMDKYGYFGGVHPRDALEVRFYPETNVLTQMKKILSEEDGCFVLPIDSNRRIYRDKIAIIDELFADHWKAHVIVMDVKFNWILIKNEFNKLIGVGNQIKKKMGKRIHMAFDKERIMYSLGEVHTQGQ